MITVDSEAAKVAALVFSILWSFAMEYLWFFKDLIDSLDPQKKQSVNALGVFLVVLAMYLLSIFDVLDWFTKDAQGILDAFLTFFIALGVAQGVHYGTKSLKRSKPKTETE